MLMGSTFKGLALSTTRSASLPGSSKRLVFLLVELVGAVDGDGPQAVVGAHLFLG